MSPHLRRLLVVAGVVFGAVHVMALPSSLEDLDSVNFALGVESFDIARHQPHPPGYPVFIALARLSTAAVDAVAPTWSRDRVATVGLSTWNVLAGAAAALIVAALWIALGLTPATAVLATLLTLASPLFWLSAARPLTDVVGLVGALAVQLGLIRGLRTLYAGGRPDSWLWAAFAAGVLVGLRTQSMWLTGPLLVWCVADAAGRRRWREALLPLVMAAAGVLAWLVPLVSSSGGPMAYLTVLRGQGVDDFAHVEMLASRPSWTLFELALTRTFVTPWSVSPLATVVLGLAVVGLVWLTRSKPRVLALTLLAFWPYLVFHLTFQETETIRYALPVLVPVCGLVAVGLATLGKRTLLAGGLGLVVVSLCVSVPTLRAYAETGAPVFSILDDIADGIDGVQPVGPVTVGMHRRVASEARQALVWAEAAVQLTPLSSEPGGEVSAVVDHFRRGAQAPVWFLADPLRHDLAAIDFRARRQRSSRRWPDVTRTLLAFMRPSDIDAWTIQRPRWMLGAGWALSPEMGGMTALRRREPHRRPAVAYVRRSPEPQRLVVAGRRVDPSPGQTAVLLASLDGQLIATWDVAEEGKFEHWIDLPSGTPPGTGPYATLMVWVRREAPARRGPAVALEHFDVAGVDDLMWTFGEGWHEQEQEPATGLTWRWMSRRGKIALAGLDRPLLVTVEGESPRRYFGHPTEIALRAGGREYGRFTVDGDFSVTFHVPSGATDVRLRDALRSMTIETTETMVPAERGESGDRRELGLRIFRVTVVNQDGH